MFKISSIKIEGNVITDEKTFQNLAKTFYDNSECNSLDEFEEDIRKIEMMKTLFARFDEHGYTNFQLLINHFIGFVNCFGIVSEQLMKHQMEDSLHPKINSLFVLIGQREFDGNTVVDEEFFICLRKALTKGN